MKLLDRIALNRTFIIIGNFLMSLVKLFTKNTKPVDILPDVPAKPVRFPWLRNILDRNKK